MRSIKEYISAELSFAELIFAGIYFREWPNSCNFAEIIFAGRLIFCCFTELISTAGEKINILCIFLVFKAGVSLLQLYVVYIFKNVRFREINFRGHLDFERFCGIYFHDI